MNNENIIFGKRLKEEREKLGISREDFAKQMNISYSALSMYERGERNAPDILKIKMANFLDVSFHYLIGITDEPLHYTDVTEYFCGSILPHFPRKRATEVSTFSKLQAELESNNIIDSIGISDERIEAIVQILINNKDFIDILEKKLKEDKHNN